MRFGKNRNPPGPPSDPPPMGSSELDDLEALAQESVLTDEDSSYGPSPPPPPPPEPERFVQEMQDEFDAEQQLQLQQKANIEQGEEELVMNGNYELEDVEEGVEEEEDDDDEDDDELQAVLGKTDPPPHDDVVQDTTQDLSHEDEEDDDDDQSVEIPPTSVVQRLINQDKQANAVYESATGARGVDDGTEKARPGRCFRTSVVMAFCLLIAAVVLAVGFGTGAFVNESSAAAAETDPSQDSSNRGIDLDGSESGTGDGVNEGTGDGVDEGTGDGVNEGTGDGVNEGTGNEGTGDGDNEGEGTGDPDGNGEQPSGRAADVQLFLERLSSNPQKLQDTNSAEAQAAAWLISDDPLALGTETAEDQFRLGQRYALGSFYFATSGDWNNEEGWMQTDDECSWYGVTCQEKQVNGTTVNTVTILNLPRNGMRMWTFPEDVVLLEDLSVLDLARNQINGGLPSNFGTLTNLSELTLRGTGMAQDLSNFDWSGMTNLRVLSLSVNDFSGTLDGITDIGETLEVLDLGTNSFSGPIPDLDVFSSLIVLNLEENQLTGTIPNSIGQLGRLAFLRLGFNSFDEQEIPIPIYTMSGLQQLSLQRCNLVGPVQGAIATLTNLKELNLDENGLTGGLPQSLFNLGSLETFTASNNLLNGPVPDFGTMTSLVELNLGVNVFTGALSDTFDQLGSLQMLRLDRNRITGAIPATITSLRDLQVLDLQFNAMSEFLPNNIGAMFNLRELYLNNNFRPDISSESGFSSGIPASLGNLRQLESLNLRSNLFNGALPADLGGLESIQFFDIANNAFNGEIPQDIGNWKDTVQTANFMNNMFTGNMPDGICGGTLEELSADCDVGCSCCTNDCA